MYKKERKMKERIEKFVNGKIINHDLCKNCIYANEKVVCNICKNVEKKKNTYKSEEI